MFGDRSCRTAMTMVRLCDTHSRSLIHTHAHMHTYSLYSFLFLFLFPDSLERPLVNRGLFGWHVKRRVRDGTRIAFIKCGCHRCFAGVGDVAGQQGEFEQAHMYTHTHTLTHSLTHTHSHTHTLTHKYMDD